jgi:hypothetical protein
MATARFDAFIMSIGGLTGPDGKMGVVVPFGAVSRIEKNGNWVLIMDASKEAAGPENHPRRSNCEHGNQKQRRDRASPGTPPFLQRIEGGARHGLPSRVCRRGPSHVVKRGKTPVLSPEEARRVLDAIDVSNHAGLRDRALIALMVFSFARIGAAVLPRRAKLPARPAGASTWSSKRDLT